MDQACGISGHPASELRRISAETGVDASDQAFSQLLDDRDQLNSFRQKFAYPRKKTLPGVDGKLCNLEDESIYLCGNSLGLMPLAAPHYINRELEKWATTGVHGHHNGDLPWARCDDYVITRSAELVGALPEEVSCQSGLSVNLHLLFAAFYNPTKERHKILMEGKAFPSDHYMVTSQAKFHGYDPETSIICVEPRKEDECIDIDELIAIIEQRGSEIAIIFLSGVQYYTGQLFDMQRITEAGHRQGCIVGFDLAHAIGNVSLRMHEWKVDFAAWCTYKYLNSGAGGIAGMFFHKKWHDDVRSAEGLEPLLRFEGWWGHQHSTRFKMDNKRDLVPGAEGFRISNPPPLLVAPLVASLEIFAAATMTRILEKQRLLTGYLEYLLDIHVTTQSPAQQHKNIRLLTPRDPRSRGCQLSITFPFPVKQVNAELEKRGVVCDVREPSVLRVAPAPLYSSFRDVFLFVRALREVLDFLDQSSVA